LSNAFKFTHAGGVTLAIGLPQDRSGLRNDALRDAERVIEFSVIDTGVGIPDDKLNLIFEAFQQADGTTSRKYGGTGLGLSISREIARLLGGEIQVDSTVGQGSRFSLFLPLIERAADAPVDTRTDDPAPGASAAAVAEAEAEEPITDDRGDLAPEDRVMLVVDADSARARRLLALVRAHGAKAILAQRASAGLGLASEHMPEVVLVAEESDRDESALGALKKHPDTRHVPVVVVGRAAGRLDALRAGAAAFVEEPARVVEFDRAMARAARMTETQARRIAVVADDADLFDQVADVLGSGDEIELAWINPADAVSAVRARPYDVGVVVVDARQTDRLAFLHDLGADETLRELPLIAFVQRELSKAQRARLDALSKSAVITVADSPERLAAQAALFLHRAEATLPAPTRKLLHKRDGNAPLQGRKALVIDDDIRNVFALTSMLERYGMKVIYAENGREGIERLHQHDNTDLVLLDIMMPEMDGYETARAIRSMPRFAHLPIISLTAQAMTGDREKALAAGASDYISKPVDVDELVSMMSAWLDV
jgi:CheY-like chemotaxis protein